MTSADSTADRLLDAAQGFVQDRGFNAFSYRDLAQEVGIRTASIHYHFPAKTDLGVAMMERYQAGLEEALGELGQRKRSAKAKLEGLVDLYRATEGRHAMCLCGSLASDFETLPDEVRLLVETYLRQTESWVRAVIEEGTASGEFQPVAKSSDLATTFVAGLQGGLLVSRTGRSVLRSVQRVLFASLGEG